MKRRIRIIVFSILFIAACGTGINLFTDSDEVAMGKQFDEEIRKNEKEYPIYNDPELKNIVLEIPKVRHMVFSGLVQIYKNGNAFTI